MPPKGTNSSKTAHVMNLLRKSGSSDAPAKPATEGAAPAPMVANTSAPAPVSAPAAAPAPAPAAEPAPRSKLPILTELNADAAVSSKIKDALENALESELLIEEAASPAPPLNAYAEADVSVTPSPAPTAEIPTDTAALPVEAPVSVSPAEDAPVVEPTVTVAAPAASSSATSGKLSQEEIERMLSAMAAAEDGNVPVVEAPAPVVEAPAPAPSSGKLSQEEIENMLRAMADAEEGRTPASASAPAAEPAPKAEQPAPTVIPTEPKPVSAPQPVISSAPEPSSVSQPVSPAEPEDKAELFNIMQLLAEEKADKYIKLFGLCDCNRCRQDVLALTLNEISTKYVVMPRTELTVRNDMYRSHYDGELTVHILRACQKVMENPRHKK